MVGDVADFERALSTIKSNLFEVIMPPAAMGSGHRGLAHKCSLMAFSWALTVGATPEAFRYFARSFVGHTSDMGVELSIPDFNCRDALKLLPGWMIAVLGTKSLAVRGSFANASVANQ